jgi:hypothetical protein
MEERWRREKRERERKEREGGEREMQESSCSCPSLQAYISIRPHTAA